MNTSIIIDCPECGQKLGIPCHQGTLHVTCPKCHKRWDWPIGSTAIPPVVTVVDDKSLRGDWVARKSRSKRAASQWFEAYVAIIVVVLVSVTYFATRDLTLARPNPLPRREIVPPKPLPPRKTSAAEPDRPAWNLPPEQPFPDNGDGVFRFKRATTTSRIRIVPRPGQQHMVVKIEKWDDPQLVCWFLIRSGLSAETSIPPGSYRLKFACGQRWYGEKDLFGPEGRYLAIDNEIRIPVNTVYTLNMTPTVNGQIRDFTIGARDF
jgi:hypothetical protein